VTMTRATAACALLVCLGACTQPNVSSSAAPTSSANASTTGVLTGLVRLYGGPINPETGKQGLNGSPGSNWTVKVLSGSDVVAKDKSDASGRFRFSLALTGNGNHRSQPLPMAPFSLGSVECCSVVDLDVDVVCGNCRIP
jgi:hypothetical protein